MSWFHYALLAALGQSVSNTFNKTGLRHVDSTFATWILMLFGLPLAIVAALLAPPPALGAAFAPALVAGSVAYLGGTWLFIHALKCGDLSVVAPLALIAPVGVTLLSPWVTGDTVSTLGMLGVAIVVGGALALNGGLSGLRRASAGHRTAVLYAVLSALFQTANALIDPIGIRASSPAFFTAAKFALMLLMVTPFAWRSVPGNWARSKVHIGYVVAGGLLMCLSTVFQSYALLDGNPGYVIAIKRLGALFSVLIASLWLRECSLRERLPAAAVMSVGAALLYLS